MINNLSQNEANTQLPKNYKKFDTPKWRQFRQKYSAKSLKIYSVLFRIFTVVFVIFGVIFLIIDKLLALLIFLFAFCLFRQASSYKTNILIQQSGIDVLDSSSKSSDFPIVYENGKDAYKLNFDTPKPCVLSYEKFDSLDELPSEYIVLDTETTGLQSSYGRIIEIAINTYKDGILQDSYSQRVNPKIKIPKEASAINGITNKDVNSMPTFDAISSVVRSKLSDKCIIGYNVDFDLRFIVAEFGRLNQGIKFDSVFDVYYFTKFFISKDEIKNYKLQTLKEYFNISEISHSAAGDCNTTFEVLQQFIKIQQSRDLQNKLIQEERISKLNEQEKQFIKSLDSALEPLGMSDKLNFNILSDKTINFTISGMQIGRLKLNGRKFKMQILDKSDNVLWLDIESLDEALLNIKHWIKYTKSLLK